MTGRWGVVDGGVQPGGRWNGEVPIAEKDALVGERDRLVGEMWSLAHGSLLTISIQVNAERHNKIADGMCTMKVQKVQGGQRCNNG